jgi:hypothetical protein
VVLISLPLISNIRAQVLCGLSLLASWNFLNNLVLVYLGEIIEMWWLKYYLGTPMRHIEPCTWHACIIELNDIFSFSCRRTAYKYCVKKCIILLILLTLESTQSLIFA